jgi:hypothetical protein
MARQFGVNIGRRHAPSLPERRSTRRGEPWLSGYPLAKRVAESVHAPEMVEYDCAADHRPVCDYVERGTGR